MEKLRYQVQTFLVQHKIVMALYLDVYFFKLKLAYCMKNFKKIGSMVNA